MIATCLVRQKTSKKYLFDYIIPASIENLKPLTLVEVPFLRKKIPAVVLEVKKSSRFAKKEIIRCLSLGPVFTNVQLDLSKEIAYEFLSDTSSALFSFLPLLNKKDFLAIDSSERVSKKSKTAVFFVESIFATRLQYYLEKIDKEKQNLIVLPEISQIEDAFAHIKKLNPSLKIFIWHSGLSSKKKSEIWKNLLEKKPCLILSTRHGLFLPFTKLENIFLDKPSNFGYFEDQEPRYNAYRASLIVSKVYSCNLFIGDSSPTAEIYAQIKNKKIDLISLRNKLEIDKIPSLDKIFSSNKFSNSLKKSRKVLVTGYFKDVTSLSCPSCEKQIICHNCSSELYNESLKCIKCSFPNTPICLTCNNMLKKSFFSFSNISKELEMKLQETASLDENSSSKLIIKSLSDLDALKPVFDLAILPFFDLTSNLPYLSTTVNLLRIIREFPTLGISHVFISTNKDNIFADKLVNLDFDSILTSDLISRKAEAMPPFTRYLEIDSGDNFTQIEKLLNIKLMDSSPKKKVAFLTHGQVKILQEFFHNEHPNIKARLDYADF